MSNAHQFSLDNNDSVYSDLESNSTHLSVQRTFGNNINYNVLVNVTLQNNSNPNVDTVLSFKSASAINDLSIIPSLSNFYNVNKRLHDEDYGEIIQDDDVIALVRFKKSFTHEN